MFICREGEGYGGGGHGWNTTPGTELLPLLRTRGLRGRRHVPAPLPPPRLASRRPSLLLRLGVGRHPSAHLRLHGGDEGGGHRVGGEGGAAQVVLGGPAPGVVAGVLGLRPAVRAHGQPEGDGGGVLEGVLGGG